MPVCSKLNTFRRMLPRRGRVGMENESAEVRVTQLHPGHSGVLGRPVDEIPAEWLSVWLTIWLCATAGLALWEGLRAALLSIRTSEGPVLTSRYALVVYASALGLADLVITVLLSQPAPEIVYKAFQRIGKTKIHFKETARPGGTGSYCTCTGRAETSASAAAFKIPNRLPHQVWPASLLRGRSL